MIIKRYTQFIKESIDYSDIIQDIKDILLELKDDGFNVKVVEYTDIINININNNLTINDDEFYDYSKSSNKLFISKNNIHIIEECIDYLKYKLKPSGKYNPSFPTSTLDSLDVHFVTSENQHLCFSYPKFIFYVKHGMDIRNLKITFTKKRW